MQLRERLNAELKEAMRSRDTLRLSTIRMVLSSVKNRDIELRRELNDSEITETIVTLCKQRRESIRLFKEAGRQELVDKEEAELALLMGYLPQQLTREELADLVAKVIAEVGATGGKDMGKVMKAIQPQVAGRAEGKLVSEVVKEKLA
ncbi:GatB/YqeY domain-containing protein [Geomonas sp. Red69]|uniref:GatB/YqeY domain-containing protein n=1 Tax=Geomonas diazotrophica TaxID=2843197 RepID=A0ABX8JFB6_9BACT|nr:MULTISPECIES: GatB/YqeY domain-containing protein [Geomonas]MBU5638004.1 GatB/YqeY domain-containing protein [Geomonas diazotrophica]QWV97008.1 GatB/YqeY domain-containing protein [Geomonas nitrogeniifigens]QXE86180.1 GatB/YqeY domain-containing protein [Geomonas nitrogeniifigens]